jgi:hypothetical protein
MWNTVKDVECHTGVKDIQISGNIGHKTQNEEKQNNLGQHWAQNIKQREANKSLRFVCFSLFCVLCPMLPEICLLLFVLCFVPNVA